jgi:hypothetical protein
LNGTVKNAEIIGRIGAARSLSPEEPVAPASGRFLRRLVCGGFSLKFPALAGRLWRCPHLTLYELFMAGDIRNYTELLGGKPEIIISLKCSLIKGDNSSKKVISVYLLWAGQSELIYKEKVKSQETGFLVLGKLI